jgi:ClpP class serine protease
MKSFTRGVLGALLVVLALASILMPSVGRAQGMSKPDIIEVIEIREVITDGTAARMKNQVEKLNENPKVKAVLLLVDTPGAAPPPVLRSTPSWRA